MTMPPPSPEQIGAEPKPLCRTCLHWKRRVSINGECWEHEQVTTAGWPANVFESDSCPEWTPKVVKA